MRPGYSVIEATNWYSYVSNNPVKHVDPTGEEIVLSEDATEEQKKAYNEAIEYLQSSETAESLIGGLEKTEEVITIEFIDNHEDSYNFATNTVEWDPSSGLEVGRKGKIQTPASGLAHEFGHAEQDLDGRFEGIDLRNISERLKIEAENLINTENPIARQLGEPRRGHYLDHQGAVRTRGPTSNERFFR